MKHRVYATRTKTDGKSVLVSESTVPYTPEKYAELKAMVLFNSLEFDELSVFQRENEQ